MLLYNKLKKKDTLDFYLGLEIVRFTKGYF